MPANKKGPRVAGHARDLDRTRDAGRITASGAAHQVGEIAALPKRHSITCRFWALICWEILVERFGSEPFDSFGPSCHSNRSGVRMARTLRTARTCRTFDGHQRKVIPAVPRQ